jgi:hypothetical protein
VFFAKNKVIPYCKSGHEFKDILGWRLEGETEE